MVLVVFPMTMRPETALLRSVAPGLIWLSLLLSMLLSAERLFQQDYDQGVIEQWLISGRCLLTKISAKIMVHWVLTMLPLFLLCPVIALVFGFSLHETGVLIVSLLCGTPAMISFCALASAFGLGMNQRGAVMALILFPLLLPVLIFGSGAMQIALQGLPVRGYLALLTAISLLAMGLLPYAITAVIRISHVD